MRSGPSSPGGGCSGVLGAAVNAPVPLPKKTPTSPMAPVLVAVQRSPQFALAMSALPSLLKSAVTMSLGVMVLVGMVLADVNATPAPAGAAQHRARSKADGSAR